MDSQSTIRSLVVWFGVSALVACGGAEGGAAGTAGNAAVSLAGAGAPSLPAAPPAMAAAGSAGTGAPAGLGAGAVAAGSGGAGSAAGSGSAPAAGSGGVAGGNGLLPGASGAATFSAIYAEILTVGAAGNCMFGACHGGPPDPNINGGLQIHSGDRAGSYKNLVNAKSTGLVCTGKTYVVPGDSGSSLLVQKFSDTPPCGGKMPIGQPLTAAQVAQIAKWIDDGALDN